MKLTALHSCKFTLWYQSINTFNIFDLVFNKISDKVKHSYFDCKHITQSKRSWWSLPSSCRRQIFSDIVYHRALPVFNIFYLQFQQLFKPKDIINLLPLLSLLKEVVIRHTYLLNTFTMTSPSILYIDASFVTSQQRRRFPTDDECGETPQNATSAAGPAGFSAGVRLHLQRPNKWSHQHVLHAAFQGSHQVCSRFRELLDDASADSQQIFCPDHC